MGLAQLQRYLGDEAAPMMVADSIQPLLTQPPATVIPVIRDWITIQRRVEGPELTVGESLFHAVERIYFLSQLKLIDRTLMTTFTEALGSLVLDLCPPDQRDLLRKNLATLGKLPMVSTQTQARVHRNRDQKTGDVTQNENRRQRRFSLLVDRLEQDSGSALLAQEEGGTGVSLREQVVAASAMSARSEDEFQRFRHQLVESGVDARTEQVFRSLAQTLPGWTLPEDTEEISGGSVPSSNRALDAMRRIITGSDIREGSKRFGELVDAAIQRFNGGSLPQAHKMFRLAQGLADEGKVRPEVLKSLKVRAAGSLAHDQLLRSAEDMNRRHLLRHVLEFFPELQIEGLLTELATADVKERRKLLLVLLEVHGSGGRPAILKELRACADNNEKDPEGFMQRNLVFLLRRISHDEKGVPDEEIKLLCRLLDPETPIIVTKEAVGAVGQIRHSSAKSALRRLLGELENRLVDDASQWSEDLMPLLDRTVAALARHGSPEAIQAVLDHGIKQEPRLGSSFARLEDLASTDLSQHPRVLKHLLDALKRALPRRFLGFLGVKHRDQIAILIRALSGTGSEEVVQRLENIAEQFPGESFGEQAGQAVRDMRMRSEPTRASGPSLAGDLELFGLSDVLQTLAGSQHTGTLTLMDQDTMEFGSLAFADGKISSARTTTLEGQAAVYQMFERPVIGSFTFRSGKQTRSRNESTDEMELEVMPLMMEAIRRHDELQHADVLVPEDIRLVKGEGKPSRPENEEDRDFLRSLWRKVLAGERPAVCEKNLAVDSYRVRCAIAHWIEEGSLVPKFS